MTELEQARAHLRRSQERLRMARAGYINSFGVHVAPASGVALMRRLGEDVIDALSWVWDAQERPETVADLITEWTIKVIDGR